MSALNSVQQTTMRQVGTQAHGGFKYMTKPQYDILKKDSKIKDVSYNIFVGTAQNPELSKTYTEIRYTEEKSAKWSFSMPATGRLPENENEIATTTQVLDALGTEHILGEDVTLDFAEKLMKMAPFGEGNERPAFAMRGVRFSDVRPLGQEGKHLSISICPCSTGTGAKIAIAESLRAIWWNRGDLVEKLRAATSSHDILFTLEISDYLYRHVELRLLAIDDD